MSVFRASRFRHAAIRFGFGIVAVAVVVPVLVAQQPAEATLQQHVDPARLGGAPDSFVVMLQGKPSGWERIQVMRHGTEWHVMDAVAIDGMVRQQSTVVLDATFRERSVRQEGEMQGRAMTVALDFADGRVKGSVQTPASGGVKVTIDDAVGATTLDDNAILPLLVGVRWHDSLAFSFPVLATSGTSNTDRWSVRVVGRDTATVPAGQFDTWKVELQTGQSPSIVHITREAPYRLVRLENGPMFTIALVGSASTNPEDRERPSSTTDFDPEG